MHNMDTEKIKPETKNTRETIEQDYRYMLFDIYCDKARAGELTLEQAMVEYMIEVTMTEQGGSI